MIAEKKSFFLRYLSIYLNSLIFFCKTLMRQKSAYNIARIIKTIANIPKLQNKFSFSIPHFSNYSSSNLLVALLTVLSNSNLLKDSASCKETSILFTFAGMYGRCLKYEMSYIAFLKAHSGFIENPKSSVITRVERLPD